MTGILRDSGVSLPRPTRDRDRLCADLDAHGYCLIADALSAKDVARMRGRLEDQAAAERRQGAVNRDPAEEAGSINQWVYMLINKGREFRPLLTHPDARALCEHLIGREFLLSSFSAHITHPGGALMPLHTDQWWLPPPQFRESPRVRAGAVARPAARGETAPPPGPASGAIAPCVYVNIMWMLVDFTEENGATRLVPGSHLSGLDADPATPHPVPTIAAEAPAGTALAWDGRTWHAAGINRARAPRYGVQTSFCGPQFRQMENYTLGTRPEVLAELTPEENALLGFRIWSGYGNTGDAGAEYAEPGTRAVGELGG